MRSVMLSVACVAALAGCMGDGANEPESTGPEPLGPMPSGWQTFTGTWGTRNATIHAEAGGADAVALHVASGARQDLRVSADLWRTGDVGLILHSDAQADAYVLVAYRDDAWGLWRVHGQNVTHFPEATLEHDAMPREDWSDLVVQSEFGRILAFSGAQQVIEHELDPAPSAGMVGVWAGDDAHIEGFQVEELAQAVVR